MNRGRFLITVAILVLLNTLFVPFTTANHLVRPKRNSDGILQILEEQILKLQDKADASDKLFADFKGFLNAIGFGKSELRSSSCGDGWSQFNSLTCIKVIEEQRNNVDARALCKLQFNNEKDISYPVLVTVDTVGKQAFLLNLLANFPSITSVWIDHGTHFTNWTTSTTGTRRTCTELLNDSGRRGGWMDVSCLGSHSIICEKTVSLSYSGLIQSNAQLRKKISFLKNITDSQSAELKAQSAADTAQSEELKSQSAELKSQSAELKSQSEELKSQSAELKSQSEELKSQSAELALLKSPELTKKLEEGVKGIKTKTEALEAAQKLKKAQEAVEALRLNRKLNEIKTPLQEHSMQLEQLQFQLGQLRGSALDMVKTNQLESLELSTQSQLELLKSKQSTLGSQLETIVKSSSGFQTTIINLEGSVNSLKLQDSTIGSKLMECKEAVSSLNSSLGSQYRQFKQKDVDTDRAITTLKTQQTRLDSTLELSLKQSKNLTTELNRWKENVKTVHKFTTAFVTLYTGANYTGAYSYILVKKCLNLSNTPSWEGIRRNTGSVNTHNSCVILYSRNANCRGVGDLVYPIHSTTDNLNYNKNVESISSCSVVNQVPLPYE